MEKQVPNNIIKSTDVLVQYKKGELNLTQAKILFSDLTGLPQVSALKFIQGLKRDNVIYLNQHGN